MSVWMWIVLTITLLVVIARERAPISAALNEAIRLLGRPLVALMAAVATAIGAVGGFVREQLQEEAEHLPDAETVGEAAAEAQAAPAPPPRGYHLSRFIGALLFTALTLVFTAGEIYQLKLCLAPMGFGSSDGPVPLGLDWLTAGSFLGVCLLWGLVLFDLYRGTRLLPEALVMGMRRPLTTAAYWCLGTALCSLLVLGIWRGLKVSEPVSGAASSSVSQDAGFLQGSLGGSSAGATLAVASDSSQEDPAPDPSFLDRFAPTFLLVSLSLLVAASSAVSGIGVVHLLRYLAVILCGVLLLLPLGLFHLLLVLLVQGMEALIDLKERLLELLGNLGQSLIRTFWPPLEALRDAAHQRVRTVAGRWSGAPGMLAEPGLTPPPPEPGWPGGGAEPGLRPGGPDDGAPERPRGPLEPYGWANSQPEGGVAPLTTPADPSAWPGPQEPQPPDPLERDRNFGWSI